MPAQHFNYDAIIRYAPERSIDWYPVIVCVDEVERDEVRKDYISKAGSSSRERAVVCTADERLRDVFGQMLPLGLINHEAFEINQSFDGMLWSLRYLLSAPEGDYRGWPGIAKFREEFVLPRERRRGARVGLFATYDLARSHPWLVNLYGDWTLLPLSTVRRFRPVAGDPTALTVSDDRRLARAQRLTGMDDAEIAEVATRIAGRAGDRWGVSENDWQLHQAGRIASGSPVMGWYAEAFEIPEGWLAGTDPDPESTEDLSALFDALGDDEDAKGRVAGRVLLAALRAAYWSGSPSLPEEDDDDCD